MDKNRIINCKENKKKDNLVQEEKSLLQKIDLLNKDFLFHELKNQVCDNSNLKLDEEIMPQFTEFLLYQSLLKLRIIPFKDDENKYLSYFISDSMVQYLPNNITSSKKEFWKTAYNFIKNKI